MKQTATEAFNLLCKIRGKDCIATLSTQKKKLLQEILEGMEGSHGVVCSLQ
jgi:hypothetical protein